MVKNAVVEAKGCAYEDLYQKIYTKEGKKHIFKLAKARSRHRQDLGIVTYIKDKAGQVLLRQEDIKMR